MSYLLECIRYVTPLLFNIRGSIGEGTEYRLTVIEDEPTALAAAPIGNEGFYSLVLLALLGTLILVVCFFYFWNCAHYRKSIKHYYKWEAPEDPGWNIFKLKELLLEVENDFLEKNIS